MKQEFTYNINGKEYKSSLEAAKDLNVDSSTILNWCKSVNKTDCYRKKLKDTKKSHKTYKNFTEQLGKIS